MTDVYQSPRQNASDSETGILAYQSDAESTSDSFIVKSPTDTNSFHSASETNNINNLSPVLNISRPLSRSSATSGLSVTATKDGIEGKRVKKNGIPGYPLNLINKMYANYANKNIAANGSYFAPSENNVNDTDSLSVDNADDGASVMSLSSMIPQYTKEEPADDHDIEPNTLSKRDYTFGPEFEKDDSSDGDYTFDVKSNAQDSFENNDYKTFLRRSSGV